MSSEEIYLTIGAVFCGWGLFCFWLGCRYVESLYNERYLSLRRRWKKLWRELIETEIDMQPW